MNWQIWLIIVGVPVFFVWSLYDFIRDLFDPSGRKRAVRDRRRLENCQRVQAQKSDEKKAKKH